MVYMDKDFNLHDDGLRIDEVESKTRRKRLSRPMRWLCLLGVAVYFYFVIRVFIWLFTWSYEGIKSCLV